MGNHCWIAISVAATIAIVGCQTRTQDPVPIIRVNSCGQDCAARRDTCYEQCTENPDNERCEPICQEQLQACDALCL
jgi:hypothetical protein